MSPPMTVTAMGARCVPPAPRPSAIGSIPKTIAAVVIRMGLSRTGPALSSASFLANPSRSLSVIV